MSGSAEVRECVSAGGGDAGDAVPFRTVAVLGLGLIGGSLARDLAARGVRVLGWNRDGAQAEAALRDGGIHQCLGDGFAGIEAAEAAVLCVPIVPTRALLAELAPRLGGARLVTDAGSTKASIVAAAEAAGLGARFVGSHPLAGDHRSGWAASREGLYRGARVFVCPGPSSSPESVELARALWEGVGGKVEMIDAAEHDRRLAWTSHLPQVLSSALGLALQSEDVSRAELGPGGRDVSRLAGSSPAMWTDIALDNAEALSAALEAADASLAAFRAALAARDEDAVRRFFAGARDWFAAGEG